MGKTKGEEPMKDDIVCGRQVDPSTARNTTYGDRNYYFCSETCEKNFIMNPLRYVDKSHSAASTAGSGRVSSTGTKEHSHW